MTCYGPSRLEKGDDEGQSLRYLMRKPGQISIDMSAKEGQGIVLRLEDPIISLLRFFMQ